MEGTTLKSLTASSPPTDGSGDPKEVKLFFKKLWHSRLSPEECKDVGSMLHMLKLSPDQKKLFDTFKEKLVIYLARRIFQENSMQICLHREYPSPVSHNTQEFKTTLRVCQLPIQ